MTWKTHFYLVNVHTDWYLPGDSLLGFVVVKSFGFGLRLGPRHSFDIFSTSVFTISTSRWYWWLHCSSSIFPVSVLCFRAQARLAEHASRSDLTWLDYCSIIHKWWSQSDLHMRVVKATLWFISIASAPSARLSTFKEPCSSNCSGFATRLEQMQTRLHGLRFESRWESHYWELLVVRSFVKVQIRSPSELAEGSDDS